MPTLTEEQKRKWIAGLGLNPDEYHLEPDAAPITQAQPESSQPLEAFLTGARRNIGGGVGGLAGSALGLKGGAAIGTAIAPGPGTAIGGLLGALTGGAIGAFGGGKVQSEVEPLIRGESEATTANRLLQEQKLAEGNKVANFAGETMPSLIGFRPSPTALLNAIKGGANLGRLSSIELPLAQKAALANTAANAGIAGGMSLGEDLLDDEEGVNIPRVLGHTAVGALINEPNRIGKILGFHPTATGAPKGELKTTLDVEQPPSPKKQFATDYSNESEESIAIGKKFADLMAKRKKSEDYGKAIVEKHNQDAEAGVDIKSDITTGPKPLSANSVKLIKPSLEEDLGNIFKDTPETSELVDDFGAETHTSTDDLATTEAERIQDDLEGNRTRYQPVKPVVDDELVREAMGYAGGNIHEVASTVTWYKSAVELFEKTGNKEWLDLFKNAETLLRKRVAAGRQNKFKDIKYQSKEKEESPIGEAALTDIERPVTDSIVGRRRAVKKGEPFALPKPRDIDGSDEAPYPKTLGISQPEADLIARESINAKGKKVTEKILDKDGNVIGEVERAGVADVGSPDRDIAVHPLHKRPDTIYHEVGHHRLRELLDNPKTRKLAENLLRHFKGDEEALIQSAGEEYDSRTKSFGVMSSLKNFYKDFIGGIKGDAARILSAKLKYDAPFSERAASRDASIRSIKAVNQNLRELSDKEIVYKGLQESPKGGFNLYDITEDGLHPLLKKGMTVSDSQLQRLGFKVSDSVLGANKKFQPVQQDTPEFKKWFGDSKVVDSEGKPLVVYHGTKNGIRGGQFDHYYGGTNTGKEFLENKLAFFFTPDKEFAGKFGRKVTNEIDERGVYKTVPGVVEDFYLKASKVLDLTDKPFGFDTAYEAIKKAKEDGYDAVKLKYGPDGGVEYAVFEPTNIKSASKNVGTFDGNNPNIRYQPIKDFETSTERELRKPTPFGLALGNDGSLPTQSVLGKISKLIPKDEYAALQESGLDDFLKGKNRVNINELSEWIENNGPKVEVKKLEADLRYTPEQKAKYERLAEINHQMDTLGFDPIRPAQGRLSTEPKLKALYEELRALNKEISSFENASLTQDSATARYTMVNPKPLDKMEGAVDILVRKPLGYRKLEEGKNNPHSVQIKDGKYVENIYPKFTGGHFGSSDKNIVGWVRGYMETLPNGEKVFHIFELQSDWAQQVRKNEEFKANAQTDYTRNLSKEYDHLHDPLLSYYESLALKAAIKHAKENGASRIAISDAETAMLTEGHDRANANNFVYTDGIYQSDKLKDTPSLGTQKGRVYSGKVKVENGQPFIEYTKDGVQGWQESSIYAGYNLESYGIPRKQVISQEKGMRQHYDQNVPNILKKLTGSEGERVDFGEHQNAVEKRMESQTKLFPDRESGVEFLRQIREQYGEDNVVGGISKTFNDEYQVHYDINSIFPRKDLIFKGANNTPKTSITARMFPISEVPSNIKPAEIFRKSFYQPIKTGTPEIDNFKPGLPAQVNKASVVQRIANRLNPFNITKSELSRISEIEPKNIGVSVSEALNKQREQSRLYEGQFRDVVDQFIDLKSPSQRDLLHRILLAENEHQKSFRDSVPDSMKPRYDKIRATLNAIVEQQNALGEMVKEWVPGANGKFKLELRPRKINEFYFPNMVSSEAIEALSKPGTAEYTQLHDDLIKHYVDNYGEESGEKFGEEAFREFVGNKGRGSDIVRFGPNRKAEGIGLPQSWLEHDAISGMRRYLKRTANDLSFYEHLESNPKVARMLGIERDQNGDINPTHTEDGKLIPELHKNANVRNVLDIITGHTASKNPTLDAAIGLVNSALLGPVGGIADFVGVPFNAAKLIPTSQIPKVIYEGFKNIKKGYDHSLDTGFGKKDPSIIRDLVAPTNRLAQKLTTARDVIYRVQGRKTLEQWTRALAQSVGESIIETHSVRAKNGDKSSQALLKKMLGSSVDFTKPIDIKKAGSLVGEVMQGTYDFRNLPMWALDSNIAPIFRLQRWSIEQTNNWMKYVWEPATKGNLEPLILSTLGAVAGGAVVKELREKLNNKESYTPTIKELASSTKGLSGNKAQLAYQMLALSTYTGYLGIVADLARSGLDTVINKNKPQSVDFPFWGFVSDTSDKVLDGIQAISSGDGNYLDVASGLATDIFKQNMQLARLGNTWLLEKSGLNETGAADRERASKYRDLRAFKQVEGLPVSEINTSAVNRYANKDTREFKRSSNLQEARTQVPNLISKAKNKANGNPEILKQELSRLRRNQYPTVPNPEANPIQFRQYIQFIEKTQGREAAIKLLQDYHRQNAINKVKSEMVPRI